MRYLFPIKLQGVGTHDVEALGSYIRRLANEHAVSANAFLNECYSRYKSEYPRFNRRVTAYQSYGGLALFVRPNKATSEILRIIEHATGFSELRSGTFLALEAVLNRCRMTFSNQFRWCPACMLEFEKVGEPGYFKLLWHLLDVTHCPEHKLKLQMQCARCGSYQTGFSGRAPCTKCAVCGAPLSHGITLTDKSNSWDAEGADLIELVDIIANDSSMTFPGDGARRTLSLLYIGASERGETDKFDELLGEDVSRILNGKSLINLTILRRLAFKLGVKISDIFLGDISECAGMLDPSWVMQLPASLRSKKRKKTPDRQEVLRRILQEVQDADSPLPLRIVSERIGVSVGYLNYHFPVLAKKIISEHKNWKSQLQSGKRRLARALAFECLSVTSGMRKSRKETFKKIRAETGLPKNLLRAEINAVYEQIQIKS